MHISPTLRAAYDFFRAHAGGIVGETARNALALARAEHDARIAGLCFMWDWDNDVDYSFVETWPTADQKRWNRDVHVAEMVRVAQPCGCCGTVGETLASLCGIVDADASYRRVIEAELALEALARVEVLS